MTRTVRPIAWVCIVLVLAACTRTSDGVPTAARGVTAADAPPSGSVPETPSGSADPGVVVTTEAPVPGSTCAPAAPPPVRTLARVSDPAAPTATIGVPDGWSMSAGDGDPEGARLDGPDLMKVIVTIAPTDLDPAAAFRGYADFLTRDAMVSTVSTLPGELCGYSGQILMGALSDQQQSMEYRDRLVHVGTPAQAAYLIVVHSEAPSGTPGFDEAAALVTDDFEIGLP